MTGANLSKNPPIIYKGRTSVATRTMDVTPLLPGFYPSHLCPLSQVCSHFFMALISIFVHWSGEIMQFTFQFTHLCINYSVTVVNCSGQVRFPYFIVQKIDSISIFIFEFSPDDHHIAYFVAFHFHLLSSKLITAYS